MTRTYLPRAIAAGARMLVEHRVDRLVVDRSRALAGPSVTACRRRTCARSTSAHVFVCGGAIQTPALLQRSGHPRRWSARTWPCTRRSSWRPASPTRSTCPTTCRSIRSRSSRPTCRSAARPANPGSSRSRSAISGARSRRRSRDWRSIAVYYAAITSEGRGRVHRVPGLRDPLVTYRLTATRPRRARPGSGTSGAGDAGGRGRRGLPVVPRGARSSAAARPRRRCSASFARHGASVMTVHLCSTVPMGEDRAAPPPTASVGCTAPTTCASTTPRCCPTRPGVNPQATVMAIAIRNARRLAETDPMSRRCGTVARRHASSPAPPVGSGRH